MLVLLLFACVREVDHALDYDTAMIVAEEDAITACAETSADEAMAPATWAAEARRGVTLIGNGTLEVFPGGGNDCGPTSEPESCFWPLSRGDHLVLDLEIEVDCVTGELSDEEVLSLAVVRGERSLGHLTFSAILE